MCLYLKYWFGKTCTGSTAWLALTVAMLSSYSSGGWFSGSWRDRTPPPRMAAATTPRRIRSMSRLSSGAGLLGPHVQLARHRGGTIEEEGAEAVGDRRVGVRLDPD